MRRKATLILLRPSFQAENGDCWPEYEKSGRKGHVGYNLVACGKNDFDPRKTVFEIPHGESVIETFSP
jgi:hypothetical protein